jgi:hypothetical protein
MPNATVRCSLIGAHFTDRTIVPDNPTEVLVRSGHVRAGVARIDLLAVDGRGNVH